MNQINAHSFGNFIESEMAEDISYESRQPKYNATPYIFET